MRLNKFIKYPIYVLGVLFLVLMSVLTYVSIALPNAGEAPELEVSLTKENIDRGRYLSYHVMMCADCHSQRDFSLFSGPPMPGTEFVGGDVFDQSMEFPGTFISANITPYGVGDWTDGELFHLITTGIKKDGDPIFPVMPYHSFGKIDPRDVEAVIAYLRTLEPVKTDHPKSKADFPVSLIMRTMPTEPQFTERPPVTDRIAYGKYMTTAAACFDCHTRFEKGKYVGPQGGGGRAFKFPDGSVVRTPNLTPHETGLKNMTKEAFIGRFKQYADSSHSLAQVKPGEFQTLMPWKMYSGMTEEDLGSIYDYLRTLEPYENSVERFTSASAH